MLYAPKPVDERSDDEIVSWVFNTAIFFGCSLSTAAMVAEHFIAGIRAERKGRTIDNTDTPGIG